jgi:hypothetical protein
MRKKIIFFGKRFDVLGRQSRVAMAEIPAPRISADRFGENQEKAPQPLVGPSQEVHLLGEGSPGVRRIEIIASHFRFVDRIFLFLGVFLIAYVYGLDGTVRYTYQVCCRLGLSLLSILGTETETKDHSHTRLKAMGNIVFWQQLMFFVPSSLPPHRYVHWTLMTGDRIDLQVLFSPRLQKLQMSLAEWSLSLCQLSSTPWGR